MIGLTSALVVLTAAAVAGFVVRSEFAHSEVELTSHARSLAGILAANADYALLTEDHTELRAFARSAFADPAVVRVAFVDRSGRTVVSEGQPNPPGSPRRSLPAPADPQSPSEVEGMLSVTAPILADPGPDEPIGQVRITVTRELVLTRVRSFTLSVAGLTAVLVAVSVLLAWLLAKRIARPLQQLQAATRLVAGGDLDPAVEPGRTAEIDELTEAFGRMTASLRSSREVIARRTAELEAKNTELERFTYTVSHDLKSPLLTIRGFLGFVRKAALEGQVDSLEADLGRIEAATDRMQQLLAELLDLSRIGRIVNPAETIQVGDLARDALRLIEGQVTEKGAEVEVASGLPVVTGDRVRLLEVIQNLLENAVKFADSEAPRVRITPIDAAPGRVGFAVSDNGLGIEPCYHEKVFGLFEKLDSRSAGTGVGLALVRRIVEVHGGRVWIESAGSGSGATFCVELLAAAQERE